MAEVCPEIATLGAKGRKCSCERRPRDGSRVPPVADIPRALVEVSVRALNGVCLGCSWAAHGSDRRWLLNPVSGQWRSVRNTVVAAEELFTAGTMQFEACIRTAAVLLWYSCRNATAKRECSLNTLVFVYVCSAVFCGAGLEESSESLGFLANPYVAHGPALALPTGGQHLRCVERLACLFMGDL